MSKKDKAIEVAIDERKNSAGEDIMVLSVNEREIGEVTPDGDRFIASLNDGDHFKVKTLDEGIERLIAEYHLHSGV